MNVRIESSWQQRLQSEFDKPYFENLAAFVRHEYATKTVYPPGSQIFAAFDACPFDQVKVVILGQDPYHEPRQAHGLCFSVNDHIPFPPSLQNIFKEIESDLGIPVPRSGNLTRWAQQGVLLLNATLTVEAHGAASHQGRGWETFTDAVIHKLAFGIYPMGIVCPTEGRFYRSQSASCFAISTPFAFVGTSGVLRESSFQSN